MDQVKSNNNIAALNHSMKSQYLTKITQLLVSISLCSFLYSPSSLLAFLQYFNFYLSTIPFQLFTHTIDKNCMFLLCNGLLVFVGITRTFSGGSSGDNDEASKYMIEDGAESQSLEIEISQPMLEEAVVIPSEPHEKKSAVEEAPKIEYLIENEEEDVEKAIVEDGKQGKETSLEEEDEESAVLDQENEDEENIEQETGDQFMIEESLEEEEEEEEEVEEENWTITTEEMNKKFDDFIKRMKADLRIEAQRQLVMV